MIRLASLALVAAVLVYGTLQSQERQKIQAVKLGDACPSFKLPGVDGKTHANAEYKKDLLLVVITCNKCPVAVQYEDRIIDFTKKFGKQIDVVAINVNNAEADKLPKMIERAKEKGFNFPYLYDETQLIARQLGATVTPHFFLFNKERKLVYKGAMDNDPDGANIKTRYLEDAVKAASAGKAPAVATTTAVGCGIAYERQK